MSDTATSTRTAASIIDGRERTDAPGGRLESTNPANVSEVVAEVLLADAHGFEDACRAARGAQRAWGAVPAPARGRVIAQVGRLFEANKESLSRLITREIGKPYSEALGEVQEIIDTCDFFLGEGRRLYGQTVPSEMPDKQLFTFRMPVGVAAIITAGNFPGAVPSWYLVPAILCGNAVVWKPADYTPALGDALTRLFVAGGLAVTEVLPEFDVPGGRRLLGLPLIVLGAVIALTSLRRWEDGERAMRLGDPLTHSALQRVVAIGVGLAAVIAAVLVAVGSR
jgi:aldehyde dehydrogenase (NAD+)